MANKRYKILLVEDDKMDQMAFKRLVEEENLPYDCTIAGSVSEAQSILGAAQFDIVITDYSLGDGTALDVLNLVKNIPVILVTGVGDEETAIKTWRAGVYDYLIKDVGRNYLKAVPVTVENVIKHKETEAKAQLLSGAIMCTDDSVYITDMGNKIIFVNKAFCKTYGYKEEDVLGKDGNILWMEMPQGGGMRGVFQIVKSAWEVGFYHKRKDGSLFPVSLSRSIIRDTSGKEVAVVGLSRDISDHILVEDELRTANLELKARNQVRSELAALVSEQIRALLDDFRSVACDVETAVQGKINSTLKEKLEFAGKKINRVNGLVSDFLDISRFDADKMKLKLTRLNLNSLISEVLEMLSPLASRKHIELEQSIPDYELVINADRDRMMQILTNLLSNAIKIVVANGHISVRVKDVGKEIVVEVEDDGPSIESGEVKRIFDRFDRIKKQLSSEEEESILGLPIVKELVEMHGGYIWVESREERGNNFCFALPKPDVEKAVVSAAGTDEVC
ncbi:MAG: PAS domain S-box protein [Planctomycetota bacterium]|nr:MAG: PAS domain S-box protein [Planctomycetota bacterium]